VLDLDLDLGAVHQPGFRPFLVRGDVSAYWTVYDGAYEPVAVADCYLRRLRFGSGRALGTTRVYAGNLAVFFEFCLGSGRSLRRAAFELDRFVHFLAVTPIERGGRGQGQLRSPERINHILTSVRELYREAVARGMLDGEVLLKQGFRLPVGVVEDQQVMLHEGPRHRLRVAKRGRPQTVSIEQFVGLMAACQQRDRLAATQASPPEQRQDAAVPPRPTITRIPQFRSWAFPTLGGLGAPSGPGMGAIPFWLPPPLRSSFAAWTIRASRPTHGGALEQVLIQAEHQQVIGGHDPGIEALRSAAVQVLAPEHVQMRPPL
jgi:hypothetical protein